MSNILADKKPKLTTLEPKNQVSYLIEVSPCSHRPEIEQMLENALKQLFNLGYVNYYYFGELSGVVLLDTEKIKERKALKE